MGKYFCTNCGKEMNSQDRFCIECGTPVDLNVDEITSKKTNGTERVIKVTQKTKIIILLITLFLILISVCSGNEGKLRLAKCNEVLGGKYIVSYNIISKSTASEHFMRKEYYKYMSVVEKLVKERNIEEFNSILSESYDLSMSFSENLYEFSEKEKIKYEEVSEALNNKNDMLNQMSLIEQGLEDIKYFEAQIKGFQRGESYIPIETEEKLLRWQENIVGTNKLYNQIMKFDLPCYDMIIQELDRCLDNMKASEYYPDKTCYYVKYNTDYEFLYNVDFIEQICTDVKNKIYWICSSDIARALYNNSHNAGPKPERIAIADYYESNNQVENEEYSDNGYNNPKKYYDIFENILDFGNYLHKAPSTAQAFDYIYIYNEEKDDIESIKDVYFEAMKQLGYKIEDPIDQNGALHYMITNSKYNVELIDDYSLDHIEVHIKNTGNSQE